MKTTLVVLLTATVLLTIAFNLMRWRLPEQPRLWQFGNRSVRRHSPRTETAIELGIIATACVVLPVAVIGLTGILIAVLAHFQ